MGAYDCTFGHQKKIGGEGRRYKRRSRVGRKEEEIKKRMGDTVLEKEGREGKISKKIEENVEMIPPAPKTFDQRQKNHHLPSHAIRRYS